MKAAAQVAVVGALVFAFLWSDHRMGDILQTLQRIEARTVQNMATITTSWKSGGIDRSVTSTQQVGESDADFVARHDRLVAEALKRWPKDA